MAKRQKVSATSSVAHAKLAQTREKELARTIQQLGEEELERRPADFADEMKRQRDADIGRRQRAAGHTSPGRRGQYKKKRKSEERITPEKRIEALMAMHEEDVAKHRQHPSWVIRSWDRVCLLVAEDLGYKTAESVRRHTRLLKW